MGTLFREQDGFRLADRIANEPALDPAIHNIS